MRPSTVQRRLDDIRATLIAAGHRPNDLNTLNKHADPSPVLVALDALEEALTEDACDKCLAPTDDGEGYDGYCGNCADRLEKKGHWS